MNILIVEDEPALSKSIVTYLKQEGYTCAVAATAADALAKTEVFDYDCILLDIMLPDGNGLDLLRTLKRDKRTDGVIVISAKDALDDKITGLQLGADDYLAKPFYLPELSARIASVIRRRKFEGSNELELNEIKIDTASRMVRVHRHVVDLTKKEFDLLIYFIVNKNRVLSKTAIAEHLSGSDADLFENFDFIYAHIKNLKKKLAAAGADDYLKSVYGMGYKFEVA
ncbi:response regulator transcription factor [Niabella drilacis]|uniref:DNA-binding response regulator, OmpR family, contains REC and winged-helix (WHTH) domain n=1 Tax=Niabella drilacis (strain DSM 25811 / CCM 8410 / CCUG 62505 / LMG 26954 / E90) TaxID=1285928 RepID=A0A1G7AM33_NIADE|nr:response regulator transcription factor [Niabella drilacis]SDE15861.1 DNA-binding response regulator, OmpR family, contains REC and winged-helix (wHTH) domain [Niabella drilacis]